MRIRDAVGVNLREIRLEHGLRQEDVVKEARRFGAKWSWRDLVLIEKGKKPVSLETLVVLLLALRETTGTTYGPSDLLGGHQVEINDVVTIDDLNDLSTLHGTLNLSALTRDPLTPAVSLFARKYDLDPYDVERAALRLWGHTFEEERDAYIDDTDKPTPGQMRVRRGRISRRLHAELLHYMKGTVR